MGIQLEPTLSSIDARLVVLDGDELCESRSWEAVERRVRRLEGRDERGGHVRVAVDLNLAVMGLELAPLERRVSELEDEMGIESEQLPKTYPERCAALHRRLQVLTGDRATPLPHHPAVFAERIRIYEES